MNLFNTRNNQIRRFSEIKAVPTDCIKFTADGKLEFCRCGIFEITFYEPDGKITSKRFKVYHEDGEFKVKKLKKNYHKKKPKKLWDPKWLTRKL